MPGSRVREMGRRAAAIGSRGHRPLLAFLIARSVTVLSLGEELAKGLGQYTALVKVIGMFVVVLLTGLQSQSPEPFLLSAW